MTTEKIQNYINGRMKAPLSGDYINNIEPATGEVYSKIPRSNIEDVEYAVEAAKAAYGSWSKLSTEKKSRILCRIADLIDQNLEKLAEAESRDNGKPLNLAKKVDIPRASSNFRFFAHAITQYNSGAYFSQGRSALQSYTIRKPLGVVACISPWNLPLYLFSWKIAPALAAGNTVVAKPSELTPYTAYLLSEICIEAGLPAGVLNIVHGLGPEAGQAMVEHDEVKAISFTGGTKTGEIISQIAASKFKKSSLELGGKNANLIFADCNYKRMLRTTLLSSFANQGQICLCGSRILVQDSIYEQFKTDFVAEVEKMAVGDPLISSNNLGAVVSEAHQKKIMDYIELAKLEGGIILTGGSVVSPEGRCKDGFFVKPTVIEGLSNTCRTNQEEIFGPVVTLQSFSSDDEAVSLANDSQYGLSATVWTENISRAHRVAADLETGIVWLNCWLERDLRTPFGGMKNSGMGREGGRFALDFFTEPKSVTIAF